MTDRLAAHHLSDATLRLNGVKMTKEALEASLGLELDRYEIARDGSLYAQIDLQATDDFWMGLSAFVRQKGPALRALQQDDVVGAVGFDIAVMFHDAVAAVSVKVPSEIAAQLGLYRIDIEFSIYRTSDEP